MKRIFLTGYTGFVGVNYIKSLDKNTSVFKYNRDCKLEINQDIVLHFAGKSHDIKNAFQADEYYKVNTELTKKIFDAFLISTAKVFITLSSVKAVMDSSEESLTEDHIPNPLTHYGKSKLLAENYILSSEIPQDKRVYILRPCMIHGAGNKGNLNLLYQLVSKGYPWPLGAFENKRSFCSIDNLIFVINELINREDIPSGIYNIADDEPVSTNEIISLIAKTQDKIPKILNLSKKLIQGIAKIGDILKLPLNSERLQKLTESYVVNNIKIRNAISKPLPLTSKVGLLKTFESFKNND